MKTRIGFVSNSSSCSFVIDLNKVPDRENIKSFILENCESVTISELDEIMENGDYPELYNLVEYDDGDVMHIWVRRDEAMDDNDHLADILFEFETSDIPPKYDRHY